MSYSYQNSDGFQVMTSKFLQSKGTCCKSNCLHCPYRFTIRNFPVVIEQCIGSIEGKIEQIFNEAYNKSDITSSLLGSAFGNNKKKFNANTYYLLSLKGFDCGIAEIKEGKLLSFYLTEHFRDQGIDEAYLMSLIQS
jgi:hypothetical protein